jgi:hypothetical protein
LLLEFDGAAECGDVVIGRKKGNQAEDDTAEHLEHAEAIEAQPTPGL